MTVEEVKKLNNDTYVSSRDIYYPNALKRIKKEKKSLRPIFEAFSNALESFSNRNDKNNKISIQLYLRNNELPAMGVTPSYSFEKFIITDNGHGFTDEDFARFLVLDDDRKSPANKGAGRMQFLHFFDVTEITSYFERESVIYERKFSISKRNEYINNSAIIKHIYTNESDKKATGTKIVFTTPLIQKDEDYFSKLDVGKLSKEIINNFILEFCKDVIPEVTVEMYVNNIENAKKVIELEDIPQERKEYDIEMSYKIKKDDKLWNFVLACPHCNSSKSNILPDREYFTKIRERNERLSNFEVPIVKQDFKSYSYIKLEEMWHSAVFNGFEMGWRARQ